MFTKSKIRKILVIDKLYKKKNLFEIVTNNIRNYEGVCLIGILLNDSIFNSCILKL